MKRVFLFALALSLSISCSPKPATTGHGSGTGNSNQPVPAVGPNIFPVVITLGTKPGSDIYYLSVAPAVVTLSVSNADQIQWIISNPFAGLNLSNIQVTKFKGGTPPNTDPFANGGTFTFGFVPQQATTNRLSGTSSRYGIYDYEVVGTLTLQSGATVSVKMDPRVIITD